MSESGERNISKPLPPSWGELFAEYLKGFSTLGPGSARKYLNTVQSLMKKAPEFSLERSALYSKEKNRAYVRGAIIKFIEFLEYRGEFTREESTLMISRIPKVREPPPKPRTLPTEEEILKVLEDLSPEDREIAMFLWLTGSRIHEALSITLKDIDFDTGSVTIYGKGRMQKKPRSVRIPLEFSKKLGDRINGLGILDGEYIFMPDSRASIKSRVVLFNRRFSKSCNKALGRSIGSHDFRRIVGCTLIEKTGNLQLVQRVLGHSSINTTTKYTQFSDINRDLEEARGIMGSIVPLGGRVNDKNRGNKQE